MVGIPSTQHLFANVLARVHVVCAAELGAGTDLSRSSPRQGRVWC